MNDAITTVVFDIGNVLIEWNPEYLYRELIPDDDAREDFLTTVCTMEWNLQQDLGRPWAEASMFCAASIRTRPSLLPPTANVGTTWCPAKFPVRLTCLQSSRLRGRPFMQLPIFQKTSLSRPRNVSVFEDQLPRHRRLRR